VVRRVPQLQPRVDAQPAFERVARLGQRAQPGDDPLRDLPGS
jgi:hypothetical protein